jgi:tetratricopeptide (TPR) repeat protein
VLNPNNAKISLLLAKTYLNHLNDTNKALLSLGRYNEYGPFWQTKCHFYLGIIHSQLAVKETSLQGRKKEFLLSLEHLAKASEIDQNDPIGNFYIALAYAEMREVKKAFNFVRLSLASQSHVSGWILLALLYSSIKEFDNVNETLKAALGDFANNYFLMLLQCEVEEIESEVKAVKSYKSLLEAMELTPLSDKSEENEILFRVANAYRRMKRIPEAMDVIKKKTHPGLEAEFHFLNGRIFEDTKKIPEAIDIYETTLIKDASHVGAQERLAIIYASQQNYVLSRSFLNSAVRLDPTNFECWYQLGTIMKKLGDLDEAGDCFITSVQLSTTAPMMPFSIIKRKID